MGRIRCQQGIPTSEIVFCLILIKSIFASTFENMALSYSPANRWFQAKWFHSNSTAFRNSTMWLEISSTGLCTICSADTRRKASFKRKR